MPELPEVETITRELSRALTGKKLRKFSVFDTEKIKKPRLNLPLTIVSAHRHGKFIVLDSDSGSRCLIHLRMTGELLFVTRKKATSDRDFSKQKHERARFHLSNGSILRFIDVRRFGTVEWLGRHSPLPRMGVEPLSRDFNPKKLEELLGGRKKAIKSALLDQRLIAGIGNIYADESLWMAGIHPMRRSGALEKPEIARLAASIGKVLREATKKGGSTLRDYRKTDGSRGDYQNYRKAYGREGEKCLRCGLKIKRIKVGGRSSYFCPACQRLKP
jgi:formamidopyrimidine-DNA glycosylase